MMAHTNNPKRFKPQHEQTHNGAMWNFTLCQYPHIGAKVLDPTKLTMQNETQVILS
jgi:hypothetical protein